MKRAPIACVVAFLLGCFAAHVFYSERVEAARERVALYELKLSVSSPDEAIQKMQNLKVSFDDAISLAQKVANQEGNLTLGECRRLMPEVANVDKETQLIAAKEIEAGNCPALTNLAKVCLEMRDQTRELKRDK